MAKATQKNILLVAYYWPPAAGSGVQRWLYLAQHLASMGHKIDVLTVSSTAATPQDEELLSKVPESIRVHRMRIWEPGRGLYRYASEQTNDHTNLTYRMIRWIRANVFFPDARCFWIAKGKRWIGRFIKSHQPDWLITTGPPHSVHMMGYAHRHHPHTRWMADFRDPWADFFVNQSLPMTQLTRKRHQKWEQKIVSSAHMVLTTTPSLKERYQIWNPRTELVFNGFEKLIYGDLSAEFSFCYAGSLKSNQVADTFWTSIQTLATTIPKFAHHTKIHIYGQTDPFVREKIDTLTNKELIQWYGYQPKSKVDQALSSARVLLFFGNQHVSSDRVINAKIFEYMAAARPVLALVNAHGDLSSFIRKHKLGAVFLYSEKEAIMNWLNNQYNDYLKGISGEDVQVDMTYSRESQASLLANLLTQEP